MCGRTELNTEWSELAAALGIPLPLSAPPDLTLPALNVPPTATIPVAISDAGVPTLKIMRWGFPVTWADRPWGRPRFNARAESARRGVWAEPLRTRRCLVPVTGFYEWIGPRTRRVPLRFSPRSGGVMALAGVWGAFQREGELVDCVSILTTAADEVVAHTHDRMPVILARSAWSRWLAAETPLTAIDAIMGRPGGELSVSRADLKRAA